MSLKVLLDMAVFKYYSYTSFQVLHASANDCNFYILQRHGNGNINTVDNSNSLAILENVAMQIKTDRSQIRLQSNRNTIKFILQKDTSLVHSKGKDEFCYRLRQHAGIAAGLNIKISSIRLVKVDGYKCEL